MSKTKKESRKQFMQRVNDSKKLLPGYNRAFVQCKECKAMAYYDYIPKSLSNPVMVTHCAHFFKDSYEHFN